MIKISEKFKKIKQAIDELPSKERSKLIEDIHKQYVLRNFEKTLKNIRKRAKKFGITPQTVEKEVEAVRREIYGPRRS